MFIASLLAVAVATPLVWGMGGGGGGGMGGGGGGGPATMSVVDPTLDSSKTLQLPATFAQENTGAKNPAPKLPSQDEATPIAPFPDPFAYVADPLGKTRSTAYADWEKHRTEMLAMIQKYEIGTKPAVDIATQVTATWTPNTPPASAPAAAIWENNAAGSEVLAMGGGGMGGGGMGGGGMGGMGGGGMGGMGGMGGGARGGGGPGGTLAVTIKVKDQSITMTASVSIPAGAKAPYPILIAAGNSLGAQPFSSRGIAVLNYSNNALSNDGNPTANDLFYKLYPEQKFSSKSVKGDTGQYAIWSWGASRIIDGLSLVKDKFPVDMNHIAVTGCSRNGKLALFAGAFDERIALTLAQESGGGGATNWRFSATEPPESATKLSVEGITNTDHAWFASQMFTYGGDNLPKLPEDHHMLTSLCAPRALYVTGNTDYTWLSNKSLYVNAKATSKVYSALGVADRFGYCVNGGHGHCSLPASQNSELDYFLDRFMLDKKELSKYVATVPATYASLDADRWTKWWGTGKADLPDAK
jgi:hypothetical protein